MDLSTIYFSILVNVIAFFTLELFIQHFSNGYYAERKGFLRKTFIIFNIIYSILPDFSYAFNFIVARVSDFIYINSMTKTSFKQKLRLCIKYWLFSCTSMLIIYIIHSFITIDFVYSHENMLYNSYKEIICNFLIYIFLSAYTNIKMKKYNSTESKTILTFNIILVIMSLFISIIPLVLKMETQDSQNLLILTFSILIILILLVLSLHRKILVILDENTMTKVELEANRLKKEYSEKIEENIAELRKLRHDMKNHFVIIDGYAHDNDTKKIISYVERMTTEYTSHYTITTPSKLISSLLNSKYQLCQKKKIKFSFSQNFNDIYLDDFDILTILGNLLDNAILASGKCEHSYISLDITQQNSYLKIHCQNNHTEHLAEENHKLLSTKENDGKPHGLGLENVQQTVDRQSGTMNIQYDSSTFIVTIIIPNYKK